jgi:type VI secretion system protein
VALLNGVGEGAKAILQRLSPESVTEAAFAEGGGLARSLAPVRAMRQWETYVARHRELAEEEDGLQAALFGAEFARAYSAVSGRRVRGEGEALDPAPGRGS